MNLVEYSDSSGSDDECSYPHEKKIKLTDNQSAEKQPTERLPVPDDILNLFGSTKEDENIPGSSSVQGKIRSFEHERGNWASFVYIPVPTVVEDSWDVLTRNIIQEVSNVVEFHPVDDFHVSLSKTFVLRHHWIESLMDSLRQGLGGCRCFTCQFTGIGVYCNEEKTRTFIGVKVTSRNLKSLVSVIDESLKEFNLPVYYMDPSFHVSIAWSLHETTTKVTPSKRMKLEVNIWGLWQICAEPANSQWTIEHFFESSRSWTQGDPSKPFGTIPQHERNANRRSKM